MRNISSSIFENRRLFLCSNNAGAFYWICVYLSEVGDYMTLLLKKMKWKLYRSLLLCLIGDGAEIVLDVKKEKGKHYRGVWIMFPENGLLTYWVYLKCQRNAGRISIVLLNKKF